MGMPELPFIFAILATIYCLPFGVHTSPLWRLQHGHIHNA